MQAIDGLLAGTILDIRLRGESIDTGAGRRPVALVSYLSFVIKFFAIHQNMGPA